MKPGMKGSLRPALEALNDEIRRHPDSNANAIIELMYDRDYFFRRYTPEGGTAVLHKDVVNFVKLQMANLRRV